MPISKLFVELALIDGMSGGLRGLTDRFRKLGTDGEAVAKKLSDGLSDVEGGLKALSAAKALKEGLVDPGIDAAGQLQAALKGLEVNLDRKSLEETKKTLRTAAADANRIAADLPYSQTDIVRLQSELKKAGLSEAEIFGAGGATEATARLAASEGMDPMEAVRAMTAISSIFGVAGDKFAASADALVRAGGASAGGTDYIADAMKNASAIGQYNSLKGNQEDVYALLGVGANMGVSGAEMGTALNSFLANAGSGAKSAKIDLFEDSGELRRLPEVIAALRAKYGDMSDERRAEAIKDDFGMDAMKAINAMLLSGPRGFEGMQAGMTNARSLDEKTAMLTGTYNAQMEALKGTAESTLASLFMPAVDALTLAGGSMNGALSSFSATVDQNPGLAKGASYGAMAATAGAGLFGLFKVLRGGTGLLQGLRLAGSGGLLGKVVGTGVDVAKAKGLAEATGAQLVSVVNWPDGLKAAGGVTLPSAATRAGAGAASMAGGPIAMGATVGAALGMGIHEAIQNNDTARGMRDVAVWRGLLPLEMALKAMGSKWGDGMEGLRQKKEAELMQQLSVVVKVDKNGDATVEAEDATTARAMARG